MLSLAGAAPALAGDDPAPGSDPEVVATGLDNPRGLAFGPGGHLYVTESGRGGDGPCVAGPESDEVCFGLTGAVTKVDVRHGGQERIATGLPSLAAPGGAEASGPNDISFARNGRKDYDERGFMTVGFGGDPAGRSQFGEDGAGLAQLYRIRPDGSNRPVVDIGAFEATENPDPDPPDTNPYSVAAVNGTHAVVADAGGNSILYVHKRSGRVEVLGVLPDGEAPAPDIPGFPVPPGTPIPYDAVPTSVALGDDGKVFVGQLTGFPFPAGAAGVWLVQRGAEPTPFETGFTHIIDVALGKDGSLYVLQIASDSLLGPPTPGALIRVAPDGTREELSGGTLTAPTGMALHRGYAYVSNRGTEAGTGEVVRIPLGDGGDDDDHGGHGHHEHDD